MVSVNPKTAALVLLTIGTLTVLLLKFFVKQIYGALKQDCRGVNNKNHAAERWDLEFVFQTPKKVFSNTTKKLFIKNHNMCFPSLQPCNWIGFRISLSLSRESAIFQDEIDNYFSCSHLARRDRDYHMTILVFREEISSEVSSPWFEGEVTRVEIHSLLMRKEIILRNKSNISLLCRFFLVNVHKHDALKK